MKVIMTNTVEMASIILKKGEVVEVTPHEIYLDTFYVTGVLDRELLLNTPQVFFKVQENAA